MTKVVPDAVPALVLVQLVDERQAAVLGVAVVDDDPPPRPGGWWAGPTPWARRPTTAGGTTGRGLGRAAGGTTATAAGGGGRGRRPAGGPGPAAGRRTGARRRTPRSSAAGSRRRPSGPGSTGSERTGSGAPSVASLDSGRARPRRPCRVARTALSEPDPVFQYRNPVRTGVGRTIASSLLDGSPGVVVIPAGVEPPGPDAAPDARGTRRGYGPDPWRPRRITALATDVTVDQGAARCVG